MSTPDYANMAKQWPGNLDEYVATHDGLAGVSLVTRAELAFLIYNAPCSGRFLEIGTACGVTAALLARARPNLMIVCVDNFVMPWPECDTYMDWRMNKQPNMQLWYGTTEELIHCFEPMHRFDAVLVDADHRYDPTISALRDAEALVRSSGTIFAHDWGNPGWPDVKTAVQAFCDESGFTIVDSYGMMVAMRVP